MVGCSIKWCGKNSRTSSVKADGITFYKFPKNPEIKVKWTDATCREGWFPNNNHKICSRHFTEDCFTKKYKLLRLMDTAVPTLYLPILNPGSPSSPEATQSSTNKNQIDNDLETPSKKRKLLSHILPTKYDTPTEKRLCRRIIELENTVNNKNKIIRKERDCNRLMKRRIESLKAALDELENKYMVPTENLGIQCVL